MTLRNRLVAALVVAPTLLLTVLVIAMAAKRFTRGTNETQGANISEATSRDVSNAAGMQTIRSDLIDAVIPPKGQRIYVSDTILVTRVSLSNIIMSGEHTQGRNLLAYEAAESLLFSNTNKLSLTEVYQRLFDVCVTGSSASVYFDALIALRFKAIVPVARDAIATWTQAENETIANRACELLHRLQHPDSLRAILWLDNEIPNDSPLRQGEQPVWWGVLPLEVFYRNDCLDVMVDVVNHPEDHRFGMWLSCLNTLSEFTNEIAVVELKKGYKTIMQWQKYWPQNDPGPSKCSGKYALSVQEERRVGKRSMYRRPKPLLDE